MNVNVISSELRTRAQSYTNNSLEKTRTTDGWFFDTPYTVSLAVRPGPEAYHASEQDGKLWNSYVSIQNLTNNVGKQDSVAWRFAVDTQDYISANLRIGFHWKLAFVLRIGKQWERVRLKFRRSGKSRGGVS